MRIHRYRHRHHSIGKGFSLIELLVVIAIIALLAGLLAVAIRYAFKAVKDLKSLIAAAPESGKQYASSTAAGTATRNVATARPWLEIDESLAI